MKPTEIPADEVWEGAHPRLVTGDGGDVPDLPVLVDQNHAGALDGAARFNIRCALEEGDLEALAAGGLVWISLYGNVVPISIEVVPPRGHLSREDAADLLLKAARGLPRTRTSLLAGDPVVIEQIHRAAIRNTSGPDGGVTLADLGRAADRLQKTRRTA